MPLARKDLITQPTIKLSAKARKRCKAKEREKLDEKYIFAGGELEYIVAFYSLTPGRVALFRNQNPPPWT